MKKNQTNQPVVSHNMDVLGYNATKQLVKASIKASQPITIEGSPGVGKTAMMHAIGKELDMKVVTLILSQCDPTDIGGFPVVQPNGGVDRKPLGPLKIACDEPVILFLDELSTAPPAVQAASLRAIHERVAGDCYFHPGTRIVAAQNPVSEAAAGWDQSLPLVGRLTKVKMKPTIEEIQDYFFGLTSDDKHTKILAKDLSLTIGLRTNLVQMTPPSDSMANGAPWAAPRAWERAIRLVGSIFEDYNIPHDSGYSISGDDLLDKLVYAAFAGNVGEEATAAFLAIRKLRNELPSVKDILADPLNAKAPNPNDVDMNVAAIGLISSVAEIDTEPAFVYAGRLTQEVQLSSMRIISKYPRNQNSKWFKEASKALFSIISKIGDVYRREENRMRGGR